MYPIVFLTSASPIYYVIYNIQYSTFRNLCGPKRLKSAFEFTCNINNILKECDFIMQQTEKPVSMPELFYDLIFAYAIGRMTQTLAMPTHGVISWLNLGEFLMMFLVFWTVWTYQTVFANRFFTGQFWSQLFMAADMFLVIYLSTALNVDFAATKVAFQLSTALLLLSVAIQYAIAAKATPNPLSRPLITILSLSGGFALISLIPSNYAVSFGIFFTGIIIAAFSPLLFANRFAALPTDFPHLTERYSLLTLLIFGEAVIAIAETLHHEFGIAQFFFFAIIVLLFVMYILVYERGIDRHRQTAGLVTIHIHYPLLISILALATFIRLYLSHELNPQWYWLGSVLTLAGFLFSLAVYLHAYRRPQVDIGFKRFFYFGFTILLFAVYSFVTMGIPLLNLLGLTAYLIANNLYYWQFILSERN